MGTEIAKRPELVASGEIDAIVPRSVEEAYRMAEMIVRAGLAPDSYKGDPKAIVVGIMKSLEVGLPPLTGLNNIAIINGRPSIWGDGAVALVQNSGYIEDIVSERTMEKPSGQLADWPDEYGHRVTIKRSGHGGGTYVGEFTIADAKRAKLWLNHKRAPWINYPDRMLYNRARAFALRDGFADALMGLSIREEMEDIPAPPPEAVDASFLEEGVLEESSAESPQPASDEGFDYASEFVTFLAGLGTKQDVENFWNGSEEQRDKLPKEDQAKMAMAYAERYAEVPEHEDGAKPGAPRHGVDQ
jgi:hypothetical protein